MNIDGTAIARELKQTIRDRVRARSTRLSLGLVVVHETPEIRKFITLKQTFGAEVGVHVEVVYFSPYQQKTEEVLQAVLHATQTYDGLVLQLPLPNTIDLQSALRLFPLSHDVDVLGDIALEQYKEGNLPFHPPVVGAMAEILERNAIRLAGKKVLVVGEGRLVGLPASMWARRGGALVEVVNKETSDLAEKVRTAEVLILGTGVPGLITPSMIQEGVLILDAGTSEMGGKLRGDADPLCAEKAHLFTPTPGGIGPITVAKIFENLLTLTELKERRR